MSEQILQKPSKAEIEHNLEFKLLEKLFKLRGQQNGNQLALHEVERFLEEAGSGPLTKKEAANILEELYSSSSTHNLHLALYNILAIRELIEYDAYRFSGHTMDLSAIDLEALAEGEEYDQELDYDDDEALPNLRPLEAYTQEVREQVEEWWTSKSI